MANLDSAIERIVETHRRVPADRCTLVAISGIDASGKGYLAANMVQALRRLDLHVANINIDGWLNLPQVRFRKNNPAENFYRNAIRFEDMFRQLVFPLRDSGSLRIEMDYAEETATIYRKQLYEFKDIDIILLEGIYLLKRQYQTYYDLSFWIDCTFETALERALARGQESLPPEATIKAYRTINFPLRKFILSRTNLSALHRPSSQTTRAWSPSHYPYWFSHERLERLERNATVERLERVSILNASFATLAASKLARTGLSNSQG